MPRPSDPNSQYRVKAHVTHGHTYASTQPPHVDPQTGRKKYAYVHWGTLNGKLLVPGAKYLAATQEERARLIFPPDWDLSLLDRLSDRRKPGRPVLEGEAQNRLYGDIWLLEQVAEKTKIRRDLDVVFEGNKEMIDAIMALAMFPYLTRFSYNRVERWQRNVKSPCGFALTPKVITLLTQRIAERHRAELLSLRASRLDKDELCAVDSTSRSAYGDSLADIHWGKNKELLPLAQMLSVVVYTLSSHMPVYYRIFPGNMPDTRSLDVILKDLEDAHFTDVALITDRGYDSLKNMEKYILKGQAMLMSVKLAQTFIMDRIKDFGSYDTCPEAMSIDRETELAWFQCDMDYEVESTNGRGRKADRLKLNIYLDVTRRAAALLKLRMDIETQKEELEELLAERTVLEGPTAQDCCDDCADEVPSDDRRKGGKTLKKHYGYYKVVYDARTRVMKSFELDNVMVARRRLLSGYFASVTHKLNFSAMEAYHHYKLRDEQEKYFEQMKDQMAADRQRCWSEEGWTGRQLILFVGMILGSYVRHIWKTRLDKRFSSSLEVLDEMRSIRCIEHPGHARKITPFVGAQLEICEAFGFEVPKGCGIKYESIRKPERKRGRPCKKKVEIDL